MYGERKCMGRGNVWGERVGVHIGLKRGEDIRGWYGNKELERAETKRQHGGNKEL